MKFLLTCSAWLESIAKSEVIKQWWTISEVKDRLVFFEWEKELIAKLNLWSRVWNKLYIVLNEWKNIDTFDKLYDLVYNTDWKKYLNNPYPIVTKATSIKSIISSTPTIQKITKKAIVDKVTNKSWDLMLEDSNKPIFEVFSFFIEDSAYILLNTSWETLYKRWYKTDTWEAPIKESLAAWIVLLSNWRFQDNFYDFTCGSWTIAIEAAMIAKNIAPWIFRHFSFENRNLLPNGYFDNLKNEAKSKIYSKKYNIIASDIDEDILNKAKINAKNAKVDDSITFIKKDLRDYKNEKVSWTLVSNPPYWLRLKNLDIKWLYRDINIILDKNKDLNWWIITAYTDFDNIINLSKYKKRKLYNWNEMCYFYSKKFETNTKKQKKYFNK